MARGEHQGDSTDEMVGINGLENMLSSLRFMTQPSSQRKLWNKRNQTMDEL